MNKSNIFVGHPFINGKRLCANVTIDGEIRQIWFETDEEYRPCFCIDRADAFIVALIPKAFRTGKNIVSEAPVSRRLLYQICHYMIPAVCKNIPTWLPFSLTAEPTDTPVPNAGAVGTGWTGGVDSMYTLMRTLHAEEPGYRLTHLVIVSNGSLESENDTETLWHMVRKAKRGIAADTGLSVVRIDSNLRFWYQDSTYLSNASYLMPACILTMQGLFRIFYNSSAYAFDSFSFDRENCFYYEMFPFSCFNTDQLTFYSAYGSYDRIDKLRELCDFPLAQKYLHPCIHATAENCGQCGKCVRTEFALYALGALDQFSNVFDLNAFGRDFDLNMARLLKGRRNQHNREVLDEMKKKGLMPSERAKRYCSIMEAAEKAARNLVKKGEL